MRRTIRAIVIALTLATSLIGSASVASADGGKHPAGPTSKPSHATHQPAAPRDITWE
jgi:hypothetical protein